jgi:hypothetical protein
MSEDHPQLISPRMLPAALRQASKFGVQREKSPPRRPPPPPSPAQQQGQRLQGGANRAPGTGGGVGVGGTGATGRIPGQGLSVAIPGPQANRGPADGHPPTARSPLGLGPRHFSSATTPTGPAQQGGIGSAQGGPKAVQLVLKVVPRVHLMLMPAAGPGLARDRPVQARLKVCNCCV